MVEIKLGIKGKILKGTYSPKGEIMIGEAIGPEVAEFVNARTEDTAKAVKRADPALSA